MKLTPSILHGAYDYLRVTPPFIRLGLPIGEEVGFHVGSSNVCRGLYWHDGVHHQIRISSRLHNHTYSLMMTMAHEMLHMVDQGRAEHGRDFQRLLRLVCRHHGFDPAAF